MGPSHMKIDATGGLAAWVGQLIFQTLVFDALSLIYVLNSHTHTNKENKIKENKTPQSLRSWLKPIGLFVFSKNIFSH